MCRVIIQETVGYTVCVCVRARMLRWWPLRRLTLFGNESERLTTVGLSDSTGTGRSYRSHEVLLPLPSPALCVLKPRTSPRLLFPSNSAWVSKKHPRPRNQSSPTIKSPATAHTAQQVRPVNLKAYDALRHFYDLWSVSWAIGLLTNCQEVFILFIPWL